MAVKRYNGSSWDVVAGVGAQGAAATSSTITTWVKTAAGGETSLSGNDDSSQSLSYTIGQELVFINGSLLKRGSDYTATSGTSINGLTALAANDVVTVWSNNAFSVTNAISNTIVDAKGDLLVGTAADTPGRLAVGTDGQYLKADSTTGTGLAWATLPSSGKVLQVVSGVSSGYIAITGSNTYADANLSLSITPTSATSKILILITQQLGSYRNSSAQKNSAYAKILRGSTTIWQSDATSSNGVTWSDGYGTDTQFNTITLHYLDNPTTTSATTYKTQWKQADNLYDHTLYMNYGTYPSQITLFEIGA